MHHDLPLLTQVIEDYKFLVRELDILRGCQLVAEVVEPETIENEDRVALAARLVRV